MQFERQLEKLNKEHEKKVAALNEDARKEREAADTREKDLKKKIEQGLV